MNNIVKQLATIQQTLHVIERTLRGDKERSPEDGGIVKDLDEIKIALYGTTGFPGLLEEVRALKEYRVKLNRALVGTWAIVLSMVLKWIYELIREVTIG